MHTRNPDFAGGRRGAAKTAGNGPAHPADMIFFWAKSNPEQPAIIQHNAAVTYKQLSEAIGAISGRIEELNLDKKEPVAVSIPHPAMQLAVCFALLRCGITTAPID